MRYHSIASRWLKLFQWTILSVAKDVEKLKPLFTDDRNAKLGNCFGKEFGNFFKNLNINLPFDPEIALLGIYPRKIKTCPPKDTCTNIHSSIIPSPKVATIQMFVNCLINKL